MSSNRYQILTGVVTRPSQIEEANKNLQRKRQSRRNLHTPSNGASASFHEHPPQNEADEASTRASKRLKAKIAAKLRKAANNCRPMDMLSNDTLANIFGFLDQTQLANTSCVCKQFKVVAETSMISLDLRKVKLPLLNQIISRYTNLSHLDFSNTREFDDRLMQLLLPVREKLQSLKLRGTKVTGRSIESFFGLTNRQRRIRLEILDLSQTMITQNSAVTVAICCPHLKSLKLSICKGITDAFMECIPLYLTKLQALDVSMCPITAKGCRSLFCVQSLRAVDISACTQLNKHAIRALVTGIIVCDEKDAPDSGDELDEIEFLRKRGNVNVSQLISISAQYMKEVDSNLLDVMTACAPHLRRLDFRHYQEVTNTNLSQFKLSLRKMQQNRVQVAFSRSNSNT